jgi:RimJ/RimL family protein N-acetyltransferase
MIQVQPTVLEGRGIRLEPLAEHHHDALVTAASDGRLWELWYTAVAAPDGMRDYIASALKGQRDGHMMPWVVRDAASGAVIGSTRYHDIVPAIDRVEIGYTWYALSRQRRA